MKCSFVVGLDPGFDPARGRLFTLLRLSYQTMEMCGHSATKMACRTVFSLIAIPPWNVTRLSAVSNSVHRSEWVSQLRKARFFFLWQPAPFTGTWSEHWRSVTQQSIDWLNALLLVEVDTSSAPWARSRKLWVCTRARAVSGLRYCKRRLGGARLSANRSTFVPYGTASAAQPGLLGFFFFSWSYLSHGKRLGCMWLSVHTRLKAGHARYIRDKLYGR